MLLKSCVILIFSAIFVLEISIFLKKDNKKIISCPFNYIVLSFVVVYGLIFPFSYFSSFLTGLSIYENYSLSDYLLYYAAIVAVTNVSLFILKKNKYLITKKKENREKIVSKKENNRVLIVAFILFAIGFVANYLYLLPYGGYNNYLKYSTLLRAGISVVYNKYSFLAPFRNCILFSSYLFIIFLKRNNKNIVSLILFVLSVILSLQVLYSNKGRLAYAIYILMIILAFVKNNTSNYINYKNITKILFSMFLGIILLSYIGNYLGRNDSTSVMNLINNEISFAFLNFKKIRLFASMSNYRYFFDIISFPFYLLPSSTRIGLFNISTASDLNTIAWYGHAKGTANIFGEMPIDYISLSYIQFGFIGIIILPFFFSIFYGYIFKKCKDFHDTIYGDFIEKYILISIGFQSLFYADPYHIIYRNFGFIVFLIIFRLFVIFERMKKK